MNWRQLPLLALLACAVAVAFGAESAGGATARPGNLRLVTKHEDRFLNYDFTARRTSRNGVDWPVNLLFWNDAEIDRVKSELDGFAPHTGSTEHGRLNDGGGWVWDEDKGRKDHKCSNPIAGTDAHHFRLYADQAGGDRMYNLTWGFYVFGTSHIDHNECWFGKWHGRSESAEGTIALWSRDVFGPSAVQADHAYFGNTEPFRREGNHIWQNDGRATFIRVGGAQGGGCEPPDCYPV